MKKQIENSFFDFVLFLTSSILGFFRSLFLFLGFRKTKLRNNIFFDFLYFIFNIWPRYFWKSPSLYKIFSFPGDLVYYLFFDKTKDDKKK